MNDPKYIQIGNSYYTVSNGQFQQISEADIVGRRGTINGKPATLDLIRQEGDLKNIDPTNLQLRPNPSGQGFEVWDGNNRISIAGSPINIRNQSEAQVLGLSNPSLSTGSLATNQDFSQYLGSTGQTYNPQTGFSGGNVNTPGGVSTQGSGAPSNSSGQQITGIQRIGNDFFKIVNGQPVPLSLPEFQSLGLNEKFVTPGTTVSLGQAQTGQAGTSGSQQSGGLDGLKFLGYTDQQIASMSPSDKQNWSMVGDYLKKQSDLGVTQAQINAETLQRAYQSALQDPNILNKYSDVQKTDVANFQNNLASFQQGLSETARQQQVQFQQQQQSLADAGAEAGRSYSGWQNRAKELLSSDQSGIVQSTRSQIADKLRSLSQPLENYFGASKFASILPNQNASYVNPLTGQSEQFNYQQLGLAGNEAYQKEQDVLNKQQDIYNLTKTA